MLAVYILTLGISAGIVGLYVRQVLGLLGFVPGLAAGGFIVLAAGSTFALLELLFVALLKLYRPTDDARRLATEAASHLAALIFVPYLIHVQLPLTSTMLQRAEPFLYLGAFAAVHLFVKLATFYASLEGAPSGRMSAAAWCTAAMVCGGFAYLGSMNWLREAEAARAVAADGVQQFRSADEFSEARLMTEGATLRGRMTSVEGQVLALRLANRPEAMVRDRYSRVYLSFNLIGDYTKVYNTSVSLGDDGWVEVRVPNSYFPSGFGGYEVRWTRKPEPNWQRLIGLQPIVYNLPTRPGGPSPPPAKLVVSGPSLYQERSSAKAPNFLVIVIDGLGASHVSMLGYERNVTPSIDRLGYTGLVFPNTHTPAEGPLTALRALVTVTSGGATQPSVSLATVLARENYAMAAFTEMEGEGKTDLLVEEIFGSGFDLVNVANPNASKDGPGSRVTLENARSWIGAHSDVKFFCLVRLRELENPERRGDYERVYPEDGKRERDVDRFDNALLYLDRQIGALLKYIRDRETRDNTCIILTSSYGNEFALGASGRRLESRTTRVPLIVDVPRGRQRRRAESVLLHDIPATIVGLSRAQLDVRTDGRNLLAQ